MATRKPYPTDVSDDVWAFVAPYLALIRQDAPQRSHELREVFNALRWIVRAGASWRMLPQEGTQQGALPAAIRPHHGDLLPTPHVSGEALQEQPAPHLQVHAQQAKDVVRAVRPVPQPQAH